MGTHLLVAWLTAGQDASLHGYLAEVLQLTVDVQVPEAAMEAGAVVPGGLAQSCSHTVFPGHAWGGTGGQGSGSLGAPQLLATQTLSSSSREAVCGILLSEKQISRAWMLLWVSTWMHMRITWDL